jgi:hypothetical protein
MCMQVIYYIGRYVPNSRASYIGEQARILDFLEGVWILHIFEVHPIIKEQT